MTAHYERRFEMKKGMMGLLVWLVVLLFALTMPVLAAPGGGNKAGRSADDSGLDQSRQMSKEKYEYQHQQEKGEKELGKSTPSDQDKPADASGLARQSDKKMEQERKELEKGSETGQQKREERSRKWWRFWE
jgi:hypothetical protein